MGQAIFAPDGTVRDIPPDQVQAALSAGGVQAVKMKDPQGTARWIPHDKVEDAKAAGGTLFSPGDFQAQLDRAKVENSKPLPAQYQPHNVILDLPGSFIEGGAQAMEGVKNMMGADYVGALQQPSQHNLSSVAGLKRTAASVNPLPPDQGQGLAPRVAQGLGNLTGQGIMLSGAGETAEAIPETIKSVTGDIPKVKAALPELRPSGGPQIRTMADAAKLPPQVITSVEKVIRAAAPTGMNQGFRANAYAAAGDLAEIARKVNLQESAGGIVNPDMRVRATVNAIGDHLNDMYQTERAPQIERNADVPVKLDFNPDAAEGLQYLARRAGLAADRELAQRVMESRNPTVAQIDRLAQVANQELKGFESMTPGERSQQTMTNRRLASLKALDKIVTSGLDQTLQQQGEGGIYAYERRFAALSKIKEQLATRMNATEINQPGLIKGTIKPVANLVKSFTGGPSGIASASQAAVADVNIGRMLQHGLDGLAKSEIVPERPQGTGMKPQQPRIAGLLGEGAIRVGPADIQNPSHPPSFENTTRAQRLGLLLPEKAGGAIPLGEPITMRPGENRAAFGQRLREAYMQRLLKEKSSPIPLGPVQ